MRGVRLCFLLPLFLFVCGSAGLDRETPAHKGPRKPAARDEDRSAVKAILFEAVMDDHSTVRVGLLQGSIEVTTPYGLLEVPAGQVRRIDFTPRPVPDAPKRVAAAIQKLRSDVFAEREAGMKELLALGAASYPAVVEATHSEDLEVKKRAQAVQEKLEKKCPAEELSRKPHDLIETPTFTIAGHVRGATLKVKTVYFGEAQLKLGDLRRLTSLARARGVIVALDSARYALPGGTAWLQTNVTVGARQRLLVTAAGEIDMYPLGGYNGQYMASPRGPKWGGAYPAPAPGAIVGRIGPSGKEFLLGEKYAGSPGETGLLYLRIVPSPWSNASTGEYRLTIRAE